MNNTATLKDLLRRLTERTSAEEAERIKAEFRDVLTKADPMAIVQAESELLAEGLPVEDLMAACDIHLHVLKGSLEEEGPALPPDHPLSRFGEEHRWIIGLLERIRDGVAALKAAGSYEAAQDTIAFLRKAAERLLEAENHNTRQENTLFPLLERHGVVDPPAIMWTEHVEMRKDKKRFRQALEETSRPFADYAAELETLALRMLERFVLHSRKEQGILYGVALRLLSEEEWQTVAEECAQLGFFDLTPL